MAIAEAERRSERGTEVADRAYRPGKRYDLLLDELVLSGRYNDANEAVRAALRLLDDRVARDESLRRAIAEGDAAYEAGDYKVYETAKELYDDIMADD